MSDDFETELRSIYFQEASENLEEAEATYLKFNENMSMDIIEKSFRFAHNLKGSSKAVGFNEVADLLHHMENVLLALKKKELVCSANIANILLEANDTVKDTINNLKQDANYKPNYSTILEKINSIKNSVPVQAENKVEPKVQSVSDMVFDNKPEEKKEVLAQVSQETSAQVSQETSPQEKQLVLPEENKAISAVENSTQNKKPSVKKEITDEHIRVSLGKIAKLQNYIGEMVILEGILKENLRNDIHPSIKNIFRQLDKNTKEVQETVMGLRLVPVKPVFQKLSRTIRDTSALLGKKINLEFIGEEIEIDKFILDQISDPLMHMVRNAVDHGIENEQERIEKNKPVEGFLSVQAIHEGGTLVINIIDDGKGLDPKVLFEKAVAKGIIQANKILTNEQCLQLIFASGFSTKVETTEISGRGVGMDVVKTNIENLNGSIQIESEVNKGTHFKIVVPLSIGILSAFIVESCGKKYVVPLHKVKEAISLKMNPLKNVPGMGNIVILRKEEIPVFDLAVGLSLEQKNENNDEKVILVMEDSNQKFGVILDKIVSIQSIVTKSLGEELRCQSGIIGSVILGDGSAVPILEMPSLIKSEIFIQNIQRTQKRVIL